VRATLTDDAASDLASAKKKKKHSGCPAPLAPERRRCFVRCRERSVATGGGGAYGWARRHARGLGAIVEGATRTFQGHRVGELVLGALLEDLRGGRKGRSVPIMPGSARLANATITGAGSTLGRGRRARGVHAEASRAKIRIDGRGDDVQHLMTRRDASRARSRAAEARCWFLLTRGLPSQIGKMARDGSRERARTCMTVSGVRPAGPAPMRISAVAVGETSSGMVVSGRREVEWNARARVSLVSMSDSFARTVFISQ